MIIYKDMKRKNAKLIVAKRFAQFMFFKLLPRPNFSNFALNRKIAPEKTIVESDVPNLVISPGGVGTSFLIHHLSRFIALNDFEDKDGLKHLPKVSKSWLLEKKILFVSGKEEDIYRSIKNRGFLGFQSAKLGCYLCQFSASKLQKYFFKKAVAKQIKTYKGYKNSNVLIIEYEDIWDNILEIKGFFSIGDDDFQIGFPNKKARTSKRK